jgi:hypothetical protein
MATFRQATIAGEQMENPVFTGPFDIYSVYCILLYFFTVFFHRAFPRAPRAIAGNVGS